MPISRVYLDTSILVANSWPLPSPKLSSLFDIAKLAGVPIFIPELVQAECGHEWLRRFEDHKFKLNEQLEALEALSVFPEQFTIPLIVFPTNEEARGRFQELLRVAMEAPNLDTSPLTMKTASDLLRMSAAHEAPFPAGDRSFRDSTIMLSIIEHVEAAGEPLHAVLLTSDKFFQKQSLPSGSVVDVGQDIKAVFKTIDEDLRELLVSELVDQWSAERTVVLEALKADQERIAHFLKANLEIGPGGVFGPKVIEVRGLTVDGLSDVTTPLQHDPDDRVRISFVAQVTLHETVEIRQWPFLAPTRLRVIQSPEPVPGQDPWPEPEISQVDVEKKVAVIAEAEIIDNQYARFHYQSATLAENMTPALKSLLEATTD